MVNGISSHGSFGSSLAVSSPSPARSAAPAEAGSGGGSKSGGAAENFKSAVLSRVERYQKSGLSDNQSPEAAQALADSLAQAAAEVRAVLGQKEANAFMAKVLTGLDKNGFSLEGLTESVGSALRDVGQAAVSYKVEQLTESFNRDLGAPADDRNGPAVKSLSRAVGDFFGLEKTENKKETTAGGFSADGRWGQVAVDEEEGEGGYVKGTAEAAELALAGSASFSLEKVGGDTVAGLADFLENELGAGQAAAYLKAASGEADFMKTMDTVIEKALAESGDPEAAARLENYLNDHVKGAVNVAVGTERNPFGQVEFEGWNFTQSAQAAGEDGQAAKTTEYSSKWRYTNRDDAVYSRNGRASAAKDEPEEEGALGLAGLARKLAGQSSGQTGELVDATA